MPNRPRPRPTPTPKAFDVFKPGKGRPSPTSRPVIMSHQPTVQDQTLVEKHGAPVSNAHHTTVPVRQKPVLKSLEPHQAPAATVLPHEVVSTEAPAHTAPFPHAPVPPHHASVTSHAPHADVPAVDTSKKVSRTGATIAPPSASAAHKLHPVAGAVNPPAETAVPAAPAAPNLAAVPITPVEVPSSLTDAKTEGKAELLAAMPIEIRRSIASAEGKQASEWSMPDLSSGAAPEPATPAPQAPVPAEMPATPAPAQAQAPAPEVVPVPQAVEQQAPAEAPTAPAPVPEVAPAAPVASPSKPISSSQVAEHRRSDAAVFIIMFVLFLLLATLVVLLFLSGSITV